MPLLAAAGATAAAPACWERLRPAPSPPVRLPAHAGAAREAAASWRPGMRRTCRPCAPAPALPLQLMLQCLDMRQQGAAARAARAAAHLGERHGELLH